MRNAHDINCHPRIYSEDPCESVYGKANPEKQMQPYVQFMGPRHKGEDDVYESAIDYPSTFVGEVSATPTVGVATPIDLWSDAQSPLPPQGGRIGGVRHL